MSPPGPVGQAGESVGVAVQALICGVLCDAYARPTARAGPQAAPLALLWCIVMPPSMAASGEAVSCTDARVNATRGILVGTAPSIH